MPRQGKAILSQVQGLLQQYLSLDYDDGKAEVQELLNGVEGVMEGLPEEGAAGPDGLPMPEGEEEMPIQERKPKEGIRDFKAAGDAAMEHERSRKKSEAKASEEEEQPDEDEDEKKRRRAKASASY